MNVNSDWFEIQEIKSYLYVIRERLDNIDPRYLTKYTNLFLLLGSKKALLIDTGAGLYPIRKIIDDLIGNRELIVINTHGHFDHIGGNEEFEEIYIHENEAAVIKKPFNAFLLKSSPLKIVDRYEAKKFKFNPPKKVIAIKEGKEFDLGDMIVNVILTPGHSNGSISLYTDRGELFTADTVHYGTIFLPGKKKIQVFQESIQKLLDLVNENPTMEIYPGHEQYPVKPIIFNQLLSGIANLDEHQNTRETVKCFGMWLYDDKTFKYLKPITPVIKRLGVLISGLVFKSK